MNLLADSGSTKTHWACMTDGKVCELVTEGLNPRFTDDDTFRQAFAQVREWAFMGDEVEALWFYGAGCGTQEAQDRVVQMLAQSFGLQAERVHVSGDLLGACRATCGSTAGWVGILGTGSNLCFYDGTHITRQRISTGFILGDEGSGNHIGRRLLKDYLEEWMPKEVRVMFHDTYPMSADQFIDRLYRQSNPNRFLASLAAFAAEHRQEPYIAAMLEECFGSFFAQLEKNADAAQYPLHLVGGITQSFPQILAQVAASHGITLGVMLGDPMPGLIDFHRKK